MNKGKQRERDENMVKVSVKVRSGTARFRVGVTAQSVRRALRLAGGRHLFGAGEAAFLKDLRPSSSVDHRLRRGCSATNRPTKWPTMYFRERR